MNPFIAVCGPVLAAALFGGLLALQADPSVDWVFLDEASREPTPCRVHLRDQAERPVPELTLPHWHDHFVCDGRVTIDLSPGRYSYEVDRGPEYQLATGAFQVVEGRTVTRTNTLRRIAEPAKEGWWSGETHVHRAPAEIELLMRAEDLHVAEVITWWNDRNRWSDKPLPENPVHRFDGNRFADLLAGEDERGGGALLFFGLDRPLAITGSEREYPPAMRFLREAKARRGAWVDVEKPFWWDTPVWLASDLVDSIGICQNHMQRGGMLDNEAWGLARNRDDYPGPHGNGLWTQDIYYHALNCGFRIPPTAGSASGVLPNPVGYNRVYAHVDGELSYHKWWDAVRAGRVFVSNGPLLRLRANGELPGHVFRSEGPLRLRLDGRLDSRDPIDAVELVRNGRVESIGLAHELTIQESGWFLVRARAAVEHTFRFASTGPFYVEIGGRAASVRRGSAEFFLDWVRERIKRIKLEDSGQQAEVMESLNEAEAFWSNKAAQSVDVTLVTGEVVDKATGAPLPARLYIQRDDGRFFFPQSIPAEGTAVRYERRNWVNRNAVEFHTTLSAHPFQVELEAGWYTVTVERGKEYRPLTRRFQVGREDVHLRVPLRRWIDMAELGWYSGDTHVHRTLEELPNVMLAEDLNVAFPLVYWVTRGYAPPSAGDKNLVGEIPSDLVTADPTHVFWPRNTEWEIFTIDGKGHTLGAVFALGHREPFTEGAPPVGQIAAEARRQGALLDLDKHDWPWSMALAPLMGVDLYELANNHMWRTEFGLTNWSTPAPAYMNLPNEGRNGNERDWMLYTFQNYYALLNCGFRLRPTAGTANGVHPVPLGYGRVYVNLPEGFGYRAWLDGLNAGRSFVTTGPMLFANVDGHPPGARLTGTAGHSRTLRVAGRVLSEQPVDAVEIVVNGRVAHQVSFNRSDEAGGRFERAFSREVRIAGSGWIAVRCWEHREGGRVRFAHTAPSYLDVPEEPLRPRTEEVDFLIGRVRNELERSAGVLSPEAMAEYRKALAAYEEITTRARR